MRRSQIDKRGLEPASKRTPLWLRKIGYRVWSFPRSLRELDRALVLLGTFRKVGWNNSVRTGLSVDFYGQPIPWLTYSAIFWLDRVLTGQHTILEVGAGYSTLWLASRVSFVTSIEHDKEWDERLRSRLPANVRLLLRRCSGDHAQASSDDPYVSAIRELPDSSVDIVMIDGMARVTCGLASLSKVSDRGLILLDDAHRPEYRPLHEELDNRGYVRIDFVGPQPGTSSFSTTSVFSRAPLNWVPKDVPIEWGRTIDDFWQGHPEGEVH